MLRFWADFYIKIGPNEIWGSVLECTNVRPAIDLDSILRRSYFYLDFQLLMNVTTVITKELTPKTIAWR